MSLGVEKHFKMRWVVDNNHLAAAMLRAIKVGSNICIYTEDVNTFLMHSMRCNPRYALVGEVDHIHASPPCKGFPRANRNEGKNDIQNNKQTLLFIKAIKHFCPKMAIFENVPGLVLEDYKGHLHLVVKNLSQMSHQMHVKVLTSSCYGNPQKRGWLILLAACGNCLLSKRPPPTVGPKEKHCHQNKTCIGYSW
jgi:site-specific DNA-cytosine methylase